MYIYKYMHTHIYTAAVSNKKCIDVCYVDFKSAFDIKSHEELLYKLKSYGISGHLIDIVVYCVLVKSYAGSGHK